MADLSALTALAATRKPDPAMQYAGEVTPQETWEALKNIPNAVLVDVRTQQEWDNVGIPDISALKRSPILLSWRFYPDMAINTAFVAELSQLIGAQDAPLFLLCRSGARSRDAAEVLTKQGYQHCYNIAAGCEGTASVAGIANPVTGWKIGGLPWAAQ